MTAALPLALAAFILVGFLDEHLLGGRIGWWAWRVFNRTTRRRS